jgi:hypothetical protein
MKGHLLRNVALEGDGSLTNAMQRMRQLNAFARPHAGGRFGKRFLANSQSVCTVYGSWKVGETSSYGYPAVETWKVR